MLSSEAWWAGRGAGRPSGPGNGSITRRDLGERAAALAPGGLAALLAACGASEAETPGTPRGSAAPATLEFYSWPPQPDVETYRGIAELFQAAHPGTRVDVQTAGSEPHYQKLKILAAAGTPPDLAYMQGSDDYISFAYDGSLLALDPLIQKDRTFRAKEVFLPRLDPVTRVRGKTYGMPPDTGAYLMLYNKDALAQAGVPEPKEDWTWDDFLESVRRLTTTGPGGEQLFGFQTAQFYGRLEPWVLQTGITSFDKLQDPTRCLLDRPEAIQAFQFLQDLRFRHKVLPTTAELAGANFPNGRVAMVLEGPWFIPSLKDATFRYDVVALPRRRRRATMFFSQVVVLFAGAKQHDAAWEFAKFINAEPAQRVVVERSGRMPTTPELGKRLFVPYATGRGLAHAQRFLDAWDYGQFRTFTPVWPKINNDLLQPAIDQMLNEQRPPETVLPEVVAKINGALQEAPKPT